MSQYVDKRVIITHKRKKRITDYRYPTTKHDYYIKTLNKNGNIRTLMSYSTKKGCIDYIKRHNLILVDTLE